MKINQTIRFCLWRAIFCFRGLPYRGSSVECPCCGKKFSTFKMWDPNDPEDKNKVCPGCGSQSRHRTILLYLQKETNIFSERARLLHFAPEIFLIGHFRKNKLLEYYTADLFSPYSQYTIDITNIAFPENSFDRIICLHVLEHIVEDRKAMTELFRILKPGGWALVQVPTDYTLDSTVEDASVTSPDRRKEMFGQHDHVRICGNDYADRLKNAGFNVDRVDYLKRLDAPLKQKYGLMEREDFFICTKPDFSKN
jgi:predicted SAM-dependent methyltransferase